jgi:hypothetical protein
MSVVNLIAALFYPDYPEAYLVEATFWWRLEAAVGNSMELLDG